MTPRKTYHSAHTEPADSDKLDYFTCPSGVALVHDVMAGALPLEYADCDVLYAEPPWQRGFEQFNTRAGVDDARTYRAFLTAVGDIVQSVTIPAVLITGAHAVPHLPAAGHQFATQLYEHSAIALCYRFEQPPDAPRTNELLAQLATRFRCVGDFCCGYGNTAQAFVKARRKFVCSDFDPRCVGYIAAHVWEW